MVITIIEKDPTNIEFWGDCTHIFKDILGDIVKSAKILLLVDYGFKEITKSDAEHEAIKIEAKYSQNKIFACDSCQVIIEFINGNSLEFRNSEWASIRKI